MQSELLNTLRSPSRELLMFDGKSFTDTAGSKYRYENGVAFIYNDADVSPFLIHDAPWFKNSRDQPAWKHSPEGHVVLSNYERARGINTDFLFSALRYEGAEGRKVVEIGVGSCEIIRRFAKIGMKAIAVDFFPWDMQDAHDSALLAGEPDFACISAPMARLPFADSSIDLLYFHAAIHHALPRNHGAFRWSDPANLFDCLAEVRRVLKAREQGGAFFLLGEGIYPEDFGFEQRYHERQIEADPENNVYESWYKISEYEDMYRRAGIFPNLFLWQENFVVQALGYSPEGRKIGVVVPSDMISDQNYWRLSAHLARHAEKILPEWIAVEIAADPFGGVLPVGDTVVSTVYTVFGVCSDINGVPVFVANPGGSGYLLFGPYVPLDQGRWEVRFAVRREGGCGNEALVFDVISSVGPLCEPQVLSLVEFPVEQWHTVVLTLTVPAGTEQVETRVLCPALSQSTIAVVAGVAFRTARQQGA